MNFALRLAGRAAVAALMLAGSLTQASTLVINTDASDPAPRAAWDYMARAYMQAHPGVTVRVNTFDHEGFKTTIRNFLTGQAPDVVTWYAGNRMAPFVAAGLFEDVSDLWTQEGLHVSLKPAAASMTINGRQWGVPYTYYPWGIYYRKDIFQRLGIAPPQTWAELLQACARLQAAGITPFAMGSKALWPTAGWFDYLNLRTNGHAFHMALTAGQVPYTDARVAAVFDRWDELVKPGYFQANHAAMDWQDAIPGFVQGRTAMFLMGNFALDLMKKGGLTRDQLGFMPFPKINDVPRAEEAPTNSAHIPARAQNKAEARRFLAFIARPEVQSRANEILRQLPVHQGSTLPDDPYLREGAALLASAAGLAQFYDRDAPAEMAKAGMEGFQRYMARPETRPDVIRRLEAARQRAYR